MDTIRVAIYYNGKMPRYHTISKAFYERLMMWLSNHPRFDCIIVVLD